MELRKRKKNPCKDPKENEKLSRRKIARHEKYLPILPPETWTKIFGYLEVVTIHTKVSLVNKNFFNLVRNSQNLAGELRISPKYVENVFKLNKAGLSLLSYDLNSKMEEMLKRWPKIETIKFTEISVFEKTEWLRNLSKTNFEKDIFYHFKDLKDMQKAWKTETLKTVSLVELWEIPEESSSLFPIQLNTSMEQEEKTLQCYDLDEEELTRVHYSIEVLKIQYDCINVTKYDAIRDIRMYMPEKETLQSMAIQMKNLEHLQVKVGFHLPFFWIGQIYSVRANELLSRDWQKAFCDFLKSQEQTLTEITLLFPGPFVKRMSQWWGPTGRILEYTKFIYESINKFCPHVHTVDTNSHLQRNAFFPYPMLGAWKNFDLTKSCGGLGACGRHFF